MMQPSEPPELRDRAEPRIEAVPHTTLDLRDLATCIAELRGRHRRLKSELLATSERLAEARQQAAAPNVRKQVHARAYARCIGQLEQHRDLLLQELTASEIDIDFEVPAHARQAFGDLRRQFDALRRAAGMTNIRRQNDGAEPRLSADGSSIGPRTVLFPPSTDFAPVHSEFAPLHLRNGRGTDLLFFPCFLAVIGRDDRLALIDVRQVQIQMPASGPESSASLIATADDRVTQRQPAAGPSTPGDRSGRHGQLSITSRFGLAETFDIRDIASCRAFAAAFSAYVAALPSGSGAFARPDSSEPLPPFEIPDLPQLPPPLHHNPWPVLAAGVLAAALFVAWRADLLPTADRVESALRGAAAQAISLAGFLSSDAPPTLAEEPTIAKGASDTGEAALAPAPATGPGLQPATPAAPPLESLAPAAGSGEAQASDAIGLAAPAAPLLAAASPVATPAPLVAAATSPLTRAEVKALQAKLQALGFQPGAVDGVAGPRTIRAVKAFQRAHGLNATGIVDRQILNVILDTPSRQTSDASSAPGATPDAPKPTTGFLLDPGNGLLSASERGR